MLSSDKNVETLAQLIEVLKDYVGLQKEHLKFDITHKMVRLIAALTVATIMFVLVIAILFYLSFAMVYWMSPATGIAGAFAIVAAFFLVLLIMILIFRKPLIIQPLIRVVADILLSK